MVDAIQTPEDESRMRREAERTAESWRQEASRLHRECDDLRDRVAALEAVLAAARVLDAATVTTHLDMGGPAARAVLAVVRRRAGHP